MYQKEIEAKFNFDNIPILTSLYTELFTCGLH